MAEFQLGSPESEDSAALWYNKKRKPFTQNPEAGTIIGLIYVEITQEPASQAQADAKMAQIEAIAGITKAELIATKEIPVFTTKTVKVVGEIGLQIRDIPVVEPEP